MKNLLQTESKALKLHIVYTGNYYNNEFFEHKLRSLFLCLNLFESAMITMLRMQREHLITEESILTKGLLTKGLRTDSSPLYNCPVRVRGRLLQSGNSLLTSFGKIAGATTMPLVCDDLESFYEKTVAGEFYDKYEQTKSYSVPQLTDEEMQLVDMKDENHLATYSAYIYPSDRVTRGNPDVDENFIEMKLSDSEYKYVKCSCERKTFLFDRKFLIHYERIIDFPQSSFHIAMTQNLQCEKNSQRSDTKQPSEKSKKCQII